VDGAVSRDAWKEASSLTRIDLSTAWGMDSAGPLTGRSTAVGIGGRESREARQLVPQWQGPESNEASKTSWLWWHNSVHVMQMRRYWMILQVYYQNPSLQGELSQRHDSFGNIQRSKVVPSSSASPFDSGSLHVRDITLHSRAGGLYTELKSVTKPF
jgi:hypothetical protein